MSEKHLKFSPQALEVLEEILKNPLPTNEQPLAVYIRKDTMEEVVKIERNEVIFTLKAHEYLKARLRGKSPLVSVDLSKDDEAGDSSREHQETENLPEGHEAK